MVLVLRSTVGSEDSLLGLAFSTSLVLKTSRWISSSAWAGIFLCRIRIRHIYQKKKKKKKKTTVCSLVLLSYRCCVGHHHHRALCSGAGLIIINGCGILGFPVLLCSLAFSLTTTNHRHHRHCCCSSVWIISTTTTTTTIPLSITSVLQSGKLLLSPNSCGSPVSVTNKR